MSLSGLFTLLFRKQQEKASLHYERMMEIMTSPVALEAYKGKVIEHEEREKK